MIYVLFPRFSKVTIQVQLGEQFCCPEREISRGLALGVAEQGKLVTMVIHMDAAIHETTHVV